MQDIASVNGVMLHDHGKLYQCTQLLLQDQLQQIQSEDIEAVATEVHAAASIKLTES